MFCFAAIIIITSIHLGTLIKVFIKFLLLIIVKSARINVQRPHF